jgi:alanine racemase
MTTDLTQAGDNGRITIDLAALGENWRALAALTGPATECGAAVKADCYGIGVDKGLPALWWAGARTFFVATPQEGQEARRLLPDATLYILNGLYPGASAFYAAHGLRPLLGSAEELREWAGFASEALAPLEAALHVDTGISRLGLSREEAHAAADGTLTGSPFRPAMVMSHLACADTPANPMSALQRQRFLELSALFPGARRSLANSAGVFLGPDYHFELARPGIALYGARAAESAQSRLATVVTLEARVLQTHLLRKGETIGYGATYTATADTRVAMIASGYADGYLRSSGSTDDRPGAEVFAGGKRLPVIGRVSMDMLGIDASALGEQELARGDFVELFGANLPVDDTAERAGTIPYEFLTGLGHRYARRYVGAGSEETG